MDKIKVKHFLSTTAYNIYLSIHPYGIQVNDT